MGESEWQDSIETYFIRNYHEGEKVCFDSTTEKMLTKLKEDKNNKKGQYAYNSIDKLVDVPRYRLREEMIDDSSHLEFKVWLQKEVEEASLGKKSSRLLWRKKKDMTDEKVQAMDTLYGLGEQIGNLLKKKLFSEKTTFQKKGDLRQLFLMDKI